MDRKRIGTNNRTIVFGATVGITAAIILSIVLAGILSYMIVNESVVETAMNYFSFFILLISSFLGAIFASRIVMRRYALIAGITGTAYLLILAAITVLVFDCTFRGLWSGVAAIALGSIVSCAVCISATGKKRSRKYRPR